MPRTVMPVTTGMTVRGGVGWQPLGSDDGTLSAPPADPNIHSHWYTLKRADMRRAYEHDV